MGVDYFITGEAHHRQDGKTSNLQSQFVEQVAPGWLCIILLPPRFPGAGSEDHSRHVSLGVAYKKYWTVSHHLSRRCCFRAGTPKAGPRFDEAVQDFS